MNRTERSAMKAAGLYTELDKNLEGKSSEEKGKLISAAIMQFASEHFDVDENGKFIPKRKGE